MVKSTRITSHSTSPHRRSARRRFSTVSRRRVRCEAMMRRRVETKCLAATVQNNNNNKHRNRCHFTIIWYVLYKNRMCIFIEHILKIIHLQIFHIYIYHMCSIFPFWLIYHEVNVHMWKTHGEIIGTSSTFMVGKLHIELVSWQEGNRQQ